MGGFFSSSAQAPNLGAMPINLEAGRNNRRNNAYNAKAPRLNNGGVNVEAPPAGPNGAAAPAINAGNNLERGANGNGAAAPRRPNNTNRNKNKNLERGNNNSRRANNVVITIQPNNTSTIASDPGSRPNSPTMAGGKRRKSRRGGRKSRRHTKKH
jgi:hypothetical protein